jgi:hypothetical protein
VFSDEGEFRSCGPIVGDKSITLIVPRDRDFERLFSTPNAMNYNPGDVFNVRRGYQGC